jgi:effector-binding domain-containing protein
MLSEPRLDDRPDQHYVAERTRVSMQDFASAIDRAYPRVFTWLQEHDLAPAGAPIIRYRAIDMPTYLDVDIGVPVAELPAIDGGLTGDTLPAGRYASLVYTGHYDGLVDATGALLDWGREQGLQWDRWPVDDGEAWGGRYETYRTDPRAEPDPSRWETEVAIRLAQQRG